MNNRYHIVLQRFDDRHHVLVHENYYFSSPNEVRYFFSFAYWSNRFELPPWNRLCRYQVFNNYLGMDCTFEYQDIC